MPELAPIQTQPPPGTCPTAEELACYIDGALSPQERARVAEHLASCESCFEVYSGVLQFQLESEPAPLGEVVPFPGEKRRPPWWSSIAALLVVGVGVGGTYFGLLASPPALPTADVAATVPASPDQNLWNGPTTRGPGGDDEIKLQEASFRMGVQLVNLQMSLKAGKIEETQNVVARIIGLLRSQSFTKDLEDGYTKITTALANGRKPADLLSEASRLAGMSRDVFEASSLDLGQWVEAGRLASASKDPTFFRLTDGRSFLRRSLWRDRFGLESLELPKAAESRGELKKIYEISGKSTLQPADFAELQDHFKKILEANYPE